MPGSANTRRLLASAPRRAFIMAVGIATLPALAGAGAWTRDDGSRLAQLVAATLRRDADLSDGTRIDVRARTDMVTLTGRAANLYERELVVRLAEGVAGVSGVSPSIGLPPPPGAAAATAFEQQVLAAARAVAGGSVSVKIDNGSVEADIRAPEEETAWRLVDAIKKVPGVSFVNYHLSLEPLPQDDASLRAAVQQALQDAHVPIALAGSEQGVSFSVAGGEVTLRGTVSSLVDVQHARDAVTALPRVSAMHDEIKVRFARAPHATSGQARTDADLEHAVVNKLAQTIPGGGAGIGVVCRNGMVILSGEVERPDLLAAAEQAAGEVSGVTGIVDDLRVRPSRGATP